MELIKNYLKTIDMHNELINLSDVEVLMKKHLQKLPFCNIPVLLGKDISLDLSKIIEKMIDNKEGGYCFEHNKLIYETLLFYGFNVKALFGRVLLNSKNTDVPKTHRFTLLIYENEKYLIDVGFGFMSPNEPIKFGSTTTKTTLNTSYVIKETNKDSFELQLIRNDIFYTLYSFDLHEYNEMDFEVGNFYSYNHKNANFVNNLVLSTIADNEIRSLRNNTYYKIFPNNKKEVTIKTLDEFTNILKYDFDYLIDDKEIKHLFENFVILK